jgi:lysophospholipase L1-like esterase
VPSTGGAQAVTAVVFYDENGNGTLDASEGTRVPEVEVTLAGRSARSAAGTGRAVIDGVPSGTHTPTVAGLPPYYAPGRLSAVTVPATGEMAVPLVLPIRSNRPNTYMAFGDSITEGNNYPGDPSYRAPLADKLRQHFGRATVIGEGAGSSKSNQGALRIDDVLNADQPAYTLILYGTNDYTQSECNNVSKLATTCFTIPSLRDIILSAKGGGSLPVLATIPPVNEGFDFRAPPQRNAWVSAANVEVRALAREQGVPLAEVEQAFLAVGDTSRLFVDALHPSAEGNELIASAFFAAIARGRAGATFDSVTSLDAFASLASPTAGRARRGSLRRPLKRGTAG